MADMALSSGVDTHFDLIVVSQSAPLHVEACARRSLSATFAIRYGLLTPIAF